MTVSHDDSTINIVLGVIPSATNIVLVLFLVVVVVVVVVVLLVVSTKAFSFHHRSSIVVKLRIHISPIHTADSTQLSS